MAELSERLGPLMEVRVGVSHNVGADDLLVVLGAAGLVEPWAHDAEGTVTGLIRPDEIPALTNVLGVVAVTPRYEEAYV